MCNVYNNRAAPKRSDDADKLTDHMTGHYGVITWLMYMFLLDFYLGDIVLWDISSVTGAYLRTSHSSRFLILVSEVIVCCYPILVTNKGQ